MTDKHTQKHTITEYVNYPDHSTRTESPLFSKNKREMIDKKNLPCWICGSTGAREVHHLHEWALWDALDNTKVLDTLKVFDPYGYTKDDSITPIETPDDIRNLLVLCGVCDIDGNEVAGGHHRGLNAGAHALTMPIFLAQRAVKPGISITRAIADVKKNDQALMESEAQISTPPED